MTDDSEFVFAALGGLGEIGMNCALYGYGPPKARQWLMVDLGVAFAGDELPGVDLIMPDVGFIEKARQNLAGIIITHAHEDHIGALADLWPSLGVQVYASPFAAGLAEARRLGEPGAPKVPIKIVRPGERVAIGPFDVEFVAVAHSIPESAALAIRTPAGLVVHTGDWKIDPTPIIGVPTDEARLRALGDEGVLALVCDSTNVLREGESPSERDVAAVLKTSSAGRRAGWSSPLSPPMSRGCALQPRRDSPRADRSAFWGARWSGSSRSRANAACSTACRSFSAWTRSSACRASRILALATGSQGEPRAALARMAENEHPTAELAPGDTVIFSSRTIPGNEKAVGKLINAFLAGGVEVITDRNALVHVSGHPRRAELARMYEWLRPKIAVPAHGEALHLSEHAAFARAQGVPQVLRAFNGDLVRFAPGDVSTIGKIGGGRRMKDGEILLPAEQDCIAQRRRLSFAGVVSIAIALTPNGEMAGDPDVMIAGLPERTRDGAGFDGIIDGAIFDTFEGLPRGKRRDPEFLSSTIERAVRNSVNSVWGKKPQVHVLVVEV